MTAIWRSYRTEMKRRMIDDVKHLKERLKRQIKRSKELDSEWVYILRSEAEKCLELAEAQDVIMDMMAEKKDG